MKQLFVAIAMMLLAGNGTIRAGDEKVNPGVLEAFKNEFTTATEVTWMITDDYYRAAFTMSGQKVFAYYAPDGEFIGLARYITSLQLPIHLMTDLKNNYASYWVSDLFELSNREGTHYYITLENADTSIKLKSSNGSSWDVYNRKRKI